MTVASQTLRTILSLPSYDTLPTASPAPQPPSYSIQPKCNEETVAFTPRVGHANLAPTGNFIRHWPQATLILRDQDETARVPSYSRGGRIVGELGLANVERIVRVTVKLEGILNLSVADSGHSNTKLVSESSVLWKHDPNSSTNEQRCPSILPLFLQIPKTFENDGKRWRMPPSYEATFLGVPAMFVKCMYTLSVTITRARSWNVTSWSTNKTYRMLINYRPRMQPPRPIIMLNSVFDSIKPIPEEWTQIVSRMNTKAKFADRRPIDCHLFVPSCQTFSLTDKIPFHLQLISTLRSLRELLPPSSELLEPPPADPSLAKHQPIDYHNRFLVGFHSIRVTIGRQIVVNFGEKRRYRTFSVGVAKLWPVPPSASGLSTRPGSRGNVSELHERDGDEEDLDTEVCLDWQGEIKPWDEVTCGGFTTGNLCVKDFLILSLTPPDARKSFLSPLQMSHPIRLVTDSWIDEGLVHPEDR